MNTFESLKTEIESCLDHYADAVQGADEDFSLSEFVSYLVMEVCDKADRLVVLEVLQDMVRQDGVDMA